MSKETRVPPQTTVDLARQLSKLNYFRAVDFQHLNDSYFTFSFHHISFNNFIEFMVIILVIIFVI
jgi:hypothetical protein